MERSYSILVIPPDETSEYIKTRAHRVSHHAKLEPHISLCTSILSEGTDFIEKVGRRLEGIDPFVFTLERVNRFSSPFAVYLTSSNQSEIERLKNLHSQIRLSIGSETKINGHGGAFLPHLTLDFFPTPKKAIKAKTRYKELFESPIPFLIGEVEVSQKIGDKRWKTIEHLRIGKAETALISLPAMYCFGNNSRASIQ
mgnify:CR=1 FL=1